jgi:hypothetical protein
LIITEGSRTEGIASLQYFGIKNGAIPAIDKDIK